MFHFAHAGRWRLRTFIGMAVVVVVMSTLWLAALRPGRVAAREAPPEPSGIGLDEAAVPAAAQRSAAQNDGRQPARPIRLAAPPREGILPSSFVLNKSAHSVRIHVDGSKVAAGGDASPRQLTAADLLARAAFPASLQQSDLIEFQPFEDETFPPEGWDAWDRIQKRQGKDDVIYTWGRETCDLDEQFGYDYAVWSSGGGSKGSLLTPCRPYTDSVSSRLFYDRINTIDYPGGLLVNFTFKLDVPAVGSFVICAPIKGDPLHYQCFWPLEIHTEGWITFPEPIAFTSVAGLQGAELVFAYEDLAPDGNHVGVFLDNVDIEGALTLPGAPTLTPSMTPTNRPTRTPSNTPSPTRGLIRPPTSTPPPTFTPDLAHPTVTPRPKQDRHDTFLPVAQRGMKDIDRYLPVPLPVWVQFGTSINPDSGAVIGLAKQFPNGTTQICAKTEWSEVGVGSRVGWTWQSWDAAKSSFVDLSNDPPFKDAATIRTGNQSDFTYQCLRGSGTGGAVSPGTYRVVPFINGQPVSEQYTAVVELPGAGGATPTPPAATATPTPEPTEDATGCRQRIENGGFEAGPGIGWGYRSTSLSRTDLAQIILKDPVAFNSEWLATIGGEASTTDELHSLVDINLLDPSQVLSATLSYLLRVNTDETKDGRIDDTFIPTWVSQDGRNEQLVTARITDEMLQQGTWFDLSYPVADRVVKRGTWTSMHLALIAKNSAVKPTTYRVDNVRLTICRKPAWMNVVSAAPSGPLEAGLDMLRPLVVQGASHAACDVIPLGR